jgi:hypothetical protein
MKKLLIILLLTLPTSRPARADMFGFDLPLLAKIVTNTLYTMYELQKQSRILEDEMRGINRRIVRIQSIAQMVQPGQWEQWKDPAEAVKRLRAIYYELPKEYRSSKSDQIEREISRAMSLVSQLAPSSQSAFQSGKEMERTGAAASPGVAQKLTASGVGTLIALESQTQVIQSHIVSLLAQTLAEANEREARLLVSRGESLGSLSENVQGKERSFSKVALRIGSSR